MWSKIWNQWSKMNFNDRVSSLTFIGLVLLGLFLTRDYWVPFSFVAGDHREIAEHTSQLRNLHDQVTSDNKDVNTKIDNVEKNLSMQIDGVKDTVNGRFDDLIKVMRHEEVVHNTALTLHNN